MHAFGGTSAASPWTRFGAQMSSALSPGPARAQDRCRNHAYLHPTLPTRTRNGEWNRAALGSAPGSRSSYGASRAVVELALPGDARRRSPKPLGPKLAGVTTQRDSNAIRSVATHGSFRQDALQCSAIDAQFVSEITDALTTSARVATEFAHQGCGVEPSTAPASRFSHRAPLVCSRRPGSWTQPRRRPPMSNTASRGAVE
jgi:hypothetical protein